MGNKSSRDSYAPLPSRESRVSMVSRSDHPGATRSINMPAIELKPGNLIRVTFKGSKSFSAECIVTRVGEDGSIDVSATKDHTDKQRLLYIKHFVKFWPIELVNVFFKLFYCNHQHSSHSEFYRSLVAQLSSSSYASCMDYKLIDKDSTTILAILTPIDQDAILGFDRKCGDKAASAFQEYYCSCQLKTIGVGKIYPTKKGLIYFTNQATFKVGPRFPFATIDSNELAEDSCNNCVGEDAIWTMLSIDLLSRTSTLPTCSTYRMVPTYASVPPTFASPTIVAATAITGDVAESVEYKTQV